MDADQYILDFLAYCYRNPIATGLVLSIAGWISARTKNKLDDRIVERLTQAVGRPIEPREKA